MPQSKVLILKLGGYGDTADLAVLCAGLRKKHPDSKITAIVRDSGHARLLFGCTTKEDNRALVDFARPMPRVKTWFGSRDFGWEGTWEWAIRHADWDFAYDARPYIGAIYRVRHGFPTLIYPQRWTGRDRAAYENMCSPVTHELARGGSSVIELLQRSMDIPKSKVHVKYTDIDLPFSRFAVLSNAVDTGKRGTKQWSFTRFADVAKWLEARGITAIQLGTRKDKRITNCVDYRGKTTILEAANILRRAMFLITVEGGLARLASLVNTPSFTIFTSTSPHLFALPNTIAIQQIACPIQNGCFWQNGEWMTKCAYEFTIKRRKEGLTMCADSVTTECVIGSIEAYLLKKQ